MNQSLLGSPEDIPRNFANAPAPTPRHSEYQGRCDEFLDVAIDREKQARRDAEFEAESRAYVEEHCLDELCEVGTKKPRTSQSYIAEVKFFVAHCDAFGCSPRPAGSATVAAYLLDLFSIGCSPEKIGKAAAAIRYYHALKDLPDPTDSIFVRAVMRYGTKQKKNGKANGLHHHKLNGVSNGKVHPAE